VAEVRFSNAAEADLVEIDEFSVTQFAEDVAEVYMHGFDEAFARLGDFPSAGPAMSGLGEGVRCLIHRSHRIFYRLDEDGVLVVRILHHSQDARRHLQQ